MRPGSRQGFRGNAAATAALAVLCGSGCATVFSDIQGARLVGRGQVELTPSVTAVWLSDEGESEHVQSHLGLQVAAGLRDGLDLRLRFERVEPDGNEAEGVNVLGFGPKVALVKERLALHVPVGFAFGGVAETSRSWQVHPTVLLTAPVHRGVDVNASTKLVVPLSGGDTLAAVNLGLGLSTRPERWVIRPEVGFLWNPGEPGHFTQFSLGLSFVP